MSGKTTRGFKTGSDPESSNISSVQNWRQNMFSKRTLVVLAVLLSTLLEQDARAADDPRVVVIRVSGALLEHVISKPLRADVPSRAECGGLGDRRKPG